MADFSKITERVFTGAALTTVDDVRALYDAGVRSIIDCRAEFDDKALIDSFVATGLPVVYLFAGVQDDGVEKPEEWYQRGIDFALQRLLEPGAVYAHCAAGVNRGPSMAYAILRALGYAQRDAWNAIRTARPVALMAYASGADAYVAKRFGL